jgi:hypothetical protein
MKSGDNQLTSGQVKSFVKLLGQTREREFDCSECLDHAGEFAESKLAGLKLNEALALVEHHLSVCPECREECEALLKILKAGL